jgi:hypothetical protein
MTKIKGETAVIRSGERQANGRRTVDNGQTMISVLTGLIWTIGQFDGTSNQSGLSDFIKCA